ncbi:MAG: hypothetical protein Q7S02_04035 [bacterium]|nr:hypothetical protein [bacterium]
MGSSRTFHDSLFIIHNSRSMIPRRGRSGATLLLALIILGGIVATSLTVGTVVVTRLRGVRAIDQSVLASYAAESGVEELLYEVRKEGKRASLDASRTLENGATWTSTVESTTRELFVTLEESSVEQLDLLPITGTITSVGVRTLLITPEASSADAWLEVTWVPWLESGSSPAVGRVLFSPEELSGRKTVDLQSAPTGGTPIAYRIRFRGLGGRVGTLAIRAASDIEGKNEVDFPSRIRATVVGVMGGARYATRAEFLPWSPVAPVFDYVLFSECDIVKGGTINCP